MSTTVIERLVNTGQSLASTTSKLFRAVAGKSTRTNNALPLAVNDFGGLMVGSDARAGSTAPFGRFRVAEPHGLLDAKQVFDNSPLMFVQSLTGGATATYLTNDASTRLRVTTTGDVAIRQTREYAPYQPGRGQLMFVTGVLGALTAGIRQRLGYFDANNGLFFEQDGTNLKVVLRSSTSGAPVDTAVNQASWNIDPLDGTGPSGITFNPTIFTPFVIDFGWLGGAGIRMGIARNNAVYYCHQFDLSALTTVFMRAPALPMRWEIERTSGGPANSDLIQTCCAAFSEGGFDPTGVVCSVANTADVAVAAGTPRPLLSVRLKSAYNRGVLVPLAFDAFCSTADSLQVSVIIRGSLTGATFAANASSGSAEFDQAATAVSGGVTIASTFLTTNGDRTAGGLIASALRCAADFAGATDILTLAVNPLTGVATLRGALTWKEIY